MDLKEFQEFLKDPDKDAWKGFTLRLRPGLAAGAINAPNITVPQEMKDGFVSYKRAQERMAQSSKSDSKGNSGSEDSEVSEEYMRKMFGAETTEYLIPKDAGNVIGADGKPLSREEVESKLPRLIDMVLRLHVVRRDKHHQRPKSESTPPKAASASKAHR
jgi:hypothetical protein